MTLILTGEETYMSITTMIAGLFSPGTLSPGRRVWAARHSFPADRDRARDRDRPGVADKKAIYGEKQFSDKTGGAG